MSLSLMVSFGLPRQFHLLLCNCLVLSLFIFCGKSNKVTKLKLQSLQVRGSHYSGFLSPSFIFSCTTIANIFAYVKCIVSYCCSPENKTLRQYPE